MKPKRELVEIEVEEVSVVDAPANLVSFNVIKSKNMEETMGAQSKEAVAVEKNGESESVATQVETAGTSDILKAMESAAKSVEAIAKSLSKEEPEASSEGDEKTVEKNSDEGEKTVEKNSDEGEKTVEKNSETVSKSENENAPPVAPDVLSELQTALSKAQALTSVEIKDVAKAVDSLQGVLKSLTADSSDAVDVANVEKKKEESATNSGAEALHKAIGTLGEQLKDLTEKVEKMQVIKSAPKSIGNDKTDSETTTVKKSLWNGLLF